MIIKKNRTLLAEIFAVSLLLTVYFFLAFSSMLSKSPTFDEIVYIAGGTSYWRNNDYRINPEGGMLSQRWAALPLALNGKVEFPEFKPYDSPFTQWAVASRFFYGSGNNPNYMFFVGRLMMLFVGAGLGALVYFWSRSLFGPLGALISLTLFAFSPTVIAHSRLVTSDVTLACVFLAVAWTLWRMFQKITVFRVALASFCLFLLFIAKMSAFFVVPMFFIMLAVRIFRRKPLDVVLFRKRFKVSGQGAVAASLLLSGIICAIVIYVGVWASFGFRYSMLRDKPAGNALMERQWSDLQAPGIVCNAVNVARECRLLPEGFLYGFLHSYKNSESRLAYWNGSYRYTGWLFFFPYCFLVKTPIPTLFFMLISFGMGVVGLARLFRGRGSEALREIFYAIVPLLTLISVYMFFAVTGKLNIGLRHILVIYPPLFILAGVAARLFLWRKKIMACLLAFALALLALDSLRIWPDYLAYFNAFAGGPENGHKHLVDSSLDWGQDLPGLNKWMKSHGVPLKGLDKDVYVSIFGSVALEVFGIEAKKLPCFFPQPQNIIFELRGGLYCISSTMLQLNPSFPGQTNGAWTPENETQFQALRSSLDNLFKPGLDSPQARRVIKGKGSKYWLAIYRKYELLRFAKLCERLRKREPDDYVGYSILIYKLSDKDVEKALGLHAKPRRML